MPFPSFFCIGYSSLERLKGLDADFVKIDKRFVQGAAHSNRRTDLFASMVDLSHRLGAQTVVEGVETAQHLDIAQQAGANFVPVFSSAAALTSVTGSWG